MGALRPFVEKNALWVSLGALLVAAGLVAVGVAVAPERFYDHFVWEDLYGPLVVDAHQCRSSTDAACASLGPPGVLAKDGYTITSELTYGIVLALLLYGIYVGLFRRYGIRADGAFVGALLPWILLGPTGRVLEDADVFCHAGTACDPNPFAFAFISPLIYIMIGLLVIGAMLLGLFVQHRSARDPRVLTAIVAMPMLVGLALFAYVSLVVPGTFTVLPPLWFMVLACAAPLALFYARARVGSATLNLTVFTLGVPFALGCLALVGRWLSGDVWAAGAWNGHLYLTAALFVLLSAIAVALAVVALGRALGGGALLARWASRATRVPEAVERRIGWAGVVALGLAALMAGLLPNFAALFESVPRQDVLIPFLALAGTLLLVAFAALHVGRETGTRPRALLVFAGGLNAMLVFGHMIDGISTWVALKDPLGFGIPQYSEKHPFSDFLLRYLDGFLYPMAKLLMILVVIWLLDREVKEDPERPGRIEDERNLVGLVKMAIFVLGFAPGLRDLLRLAMGV